LTAEVPPYNLETSPTHYSLLTTARIYLTLTDTAAEWLRDPDVPVTVIVNRPVVEPGPTVTVDTA
jgi:hypothetical protein